jgi:hypothetical protein
MEDRLGETQFLVRRPGAPTGGPTLMIDGEWRCQ